MKRMRLPPYSQSTLKYAYHGHDGNVMALYWLGVTKQKDGYNVIVY